MLLSIIFIIDFMKLVLLKDIGLEAVTMRSFEK